MATSHIKSTAIVIGYNPNGQCVYSEIMDLLDYYDGEHVWDTAASVKRLKLQRVKGYLFGADGKLNQEFENIFDLSTGLYKSGHTRYADGTERTDSQDSETDTESDAAADDGEGLIEMLSVSRTAPCMTLCERCHEREASVYVTIVDVDSGAVTNHDYCELCAVDPQGGGKLGGG